MKKIILIGIFTLILSGCIEYSRQDLKNIRTDEIVEERPNPCPEWIDEVPAKTDEYIYFVGLSRHYSEEKDARRDALMDSINQFAAYSGVKVKKLHKYLAVSFGKASAVSDPKISSKDYEKHVVDAFVGLVKASKFCTQKVRFMSGSTALEISYKTYVLAEVPVDEAKRVMTEVGDHPSSAPPQLFYKKMSGRLYLIWNISNQARRDISIYQILPDGKIQLIDTIRNTNETKYLLNNYKWGNSYKIRVKDNAGNGADSNSVKLDDYCEEQDDIFYLISDNTGDQFFSNHGYINDFEQTLIKFFQEVKLSFNKKNAFCAKNILYLSLVKEPDMSGYRINAENIETGAIFFRGGYIYKVDDDYLRMVVNDREILKNAIKEHFQETQKMIKPSAVQIQMIDVDNQVSLRNAENICRNRGGRLLTSDEWFANHKYFEDKKEVGEYVIDGRIYFKYGKWRFEGIFMPQASNPYRVRCRIDN